MGRGIPGLVLDHSTGYMPIGNGFLGLCGRMYEQWACRFIARRGFAFYGVSGAVCRWLQTFGVRAAGTLPNAVDPAETAALAAAAKPENWRAALGLAPGAKLAAFVGRLIPEKGAAALVQAARELPDLAVAIAGNGPLRADLEAQKPPNVFLLGDIPHAAVLRLLSEADVYCLPTEYAEGFPTTLLEAAACHCPILCTRTAGTDELLPDDSHAVFLADARPGTIRAGLETVLGDPAAAKCRTETAYRTLTAHFTWDAVFAMMESIAGAV